MGPLLKKGGVGCDISPRLRSVLGPTWMSREARPATFCRSVIMSH